MIVSFRCKCGEWILVDSNDVSKSIQCERCGRQNKVPAVVRFNCPKCSASLSVLAENCEEKIQCWSCGNISYVPLKTEKPRTKKCPTCYELIYKEARKCRFCGDFLYDVNQNSSFFTKIFPFSFLNKFFKRKSREMEFTIIPVKRISPNPYQPREYMDKESLEKLKVSIKNFGIIVPLIVRRCGDSFELVAGQRRLLAAKELGFNSVPAIIRNLSNREVMEIGYLENLHRKELKSIEEARTIERIHTEYPEMGYELLSMKFGKDLNEVRKNLKLTKLPIILQEAIGQNMISDDQARFLSLIPSPESLIEAISKVYKNKLNLDQTINLVDEYRMQEVQMRMWNSR